MMEVRELLLDAAKLLSNGVKEGGNTEPLKDFESLLEDGRINRILSDTNQSNVDLLYYLLTVGIQKLKEKRKDTNRPASGESSSPSPSPSPTVELGKNGGSGSRVSSSELIKTLLQEDSQFMKELLTLQKSLKALKNTIDDAHRSTVIQQVKVLLRLLLSKENVQTQISTKAKRFLSKWETISARPLPSAFIKKLDDPTVNIGATLGQFQSGTISVFQLFDFISHTVILPVLQDYLRLIPLPNITLTLADNAISKIVLQLTNLNLSIPHGISRLQLRTETDSDFNFADSAGTAISAAKVNTKIIITIPELIVELLGINFDYNEKTLFLVLKQSGSFDVKIPKLHSTIPIELKREDDNLFYFNDKNNSNDGVKVVLTGFTISFSGSGGNAEILNKLTHTFNQEIAQGIGSLVQKKMSEIVGDLLKQANEWLQLIQKKKSNDNQTAGQITNTNTTTTATTNDCQILKNGST